MTDTNQKLRADFEAWWDGELEDHNGHPTVASLRAWGAWQAAAVKYAPPQAQQPIAGPLFCDMKTDADKANFFLSGRGYETGVIAKAVQNDVAMAYQRCANYAKQSQQSQAQRGQVMRELSTEIARLTNEMAGLRATPTVPQGYEIHEIPADYSGLVWLEGQVRAVARLAQAATGPQGWTDADSDSARLALELECLLMDTKDLSVVSKWWASANEALELHRQRLAVTPAPEPAQEPVTLTESERMKCLVDSGCIGTVKMAYDSGRYKITRTSINSDRLIDSVIAALRAKGGK